MSKQFCEVCLEDRSLERIEIEEEVTIKDSTFSVLHEYDQCESCSELFEPVEDIDKNLKLDYRAYRKRVGFLQPEEIKQIREKYGMNLRQFAELLGIGYSTLSHLENGSLQSWYQNSLFVLVESPEAMYTLLKDRLEYTKENYDDTLEIVKELSRKENEKIFKMAEELEEKIEWISDKTLYNTRRMNDIEFNAKEANSTDHKNKIRKEKKFSWTKTTLSLLTLN